MMKKGGQKLTLHRPATYQIKVPGELDKRWSDWAGMLGITVGCDEDGLPVTIFTSTSDQAALLGLLRRLYSLGIPLISVICIDRG